MSTRADELAWFKENAPMWGWQWARTFAKSAPHSYVIRDKLLNREDYQRAFMLSQMLGRPRKFYRNVNIELEIPDLTMGYGPKVRREEITGFKFWPMSHQRSTSKSFNVAPFGLYYGTQDAPDTTTSEDHPFDFTAGDWDDLRLASVGESYANLSIPLWKIVLGDRAVPSILDLGPRIGFALDMKIVSKNQAYRAVDPSQGMLNQLLFRHQWVRDIHPMTVESYLSSEADGEHFDTGIALLGTASYLAPSTIRDLPSVVRNLVLMFYLDQADDWYGPTHLPPTAGDALRTAVGLPGAVMKRMGRYAMVQVRQ